MLPHTIFCHLLLLKLLFVGNYVFYKLLLVGVSIAYWKRCLLEMLFSNNYYMLQELLFTRGVVVLQLLSFIKRIIVFNYYSYYLIEELLLSFLTPSILAHQNPQKGEQLTRMMMTKTKTQNIGGV
jgi:hypothetical protein